MATSTLVPLNEYLQTIYRPDCDWICGEVRERNIGETPHASVQTFLAFLFLSHEEEWGYVCLYGAAGSDVRRSLSRGSLCAVRRCVGIEPILRKAPALCVEILSRDDAMSDMADRVADYHGMGVTAVWVIDPWDRRAYFSSATGIEEVVDFLLVPGSAVCVHVPDIFRRLEKVLQLPGVG